MKKAMVFLLSIIILAVFAATAYAQDFKVTGNKLVSLCPCSNQGYVVYVENNKDASANYKVSFGGSAAAAVKAVPPEFSISPNAKSYFFVFVNSACNIRGPYGLRVFVAEDNANTKEISQILNFTECYAYNLSLGDPVKNTKADAIDFSLHKGAYDICAEQQLAIPVLISNKEGFPNTYSLSLDGEEWSMLELNKAQLEGNKQGIVLLKLNPPKGSEGKYTLSLKAVSGLGNVYQQKNIDISVTRCYGLNIDILENEAAICQAGNSIGVMIENDGTSLESVTFNVTPNIADFPESIVIPGDSSRTLYIGFNNLEIPSGMYNVTVRGKIDDTSVEGQDSIKVNFASVEDCYQPVISLNKDITNRFTEEYYPVDVVNSGLKSANYTIFIDGPSWITATKSSIELKPGSKSNFNIHALPSGQNESKYKATLVLASGGASYSEEINIKLAKENWLTKWLKDFFMYNTFYAYTIIFLLLVVIISIKPLAAVFRLSNERKGKYRQGIEKKRQKEEARKLREEQSLEERKAREEKASEKKALRHPRKKLKGILFRAILMTAFIALAAFAVYSFSETVFEFFIFYAYYIIAGIVLLLVVIFILNLQRKR